MRSHRRQELSISDTQWTLSRNCHNKCFELLKKASSYTEVKYHRGDILMTQSTKCYSRLIACHSIKELGSFSLCPLDQILRRCVRCTLYSSHVLLFGLRLSAMFNTVSCPKTQFPWGIPALVWRKSCPCLEPKIYVPPLPI